MLKKLLILSGIVLFLSCGGGSSKEAKELLQKILTIIGIPPSIITNICQTSNQSDICEGMTLHKSSNKKNKPWQKITQTEIGQYLLETNIPCEPILLELKDGEVVDDNGEFFLKFSGVELGVKEKELSILEAMVDASYLTSSSVSAIKSLHSVETQNSFYATLYQDLKTNINTLSTRGLTKTQAIRGTLKEMAEELSSYGVESSLPAKLNSCNSDRACVESELTELSSKLVIYASEVDLIVEAQKDNDSPLKVREVSCEKESVSLKNGLVAYYKFEGDAKDSSGNGNDGVEHGGVSYSDGVIGQAGRFDGSDDNGGDDWISASAPINTNSSFSVASFVKPTKISSRANTIIMERDKDSNDICGNSSAPNYSLQIYGGVFALDISTLNNNICTHTRISTTWNVEAGKVYYVVGIYDKNRGQLKLYVNNILESYISVGKDLRTDLNAIFKIGHNHNSGYYVQEWSGLIDDLRIYNRALNETEIKELYAMGVN